jgi:hypothetical protein
MQGDRGVTPKKGGFQAQVTGKYLGWFPKKSQAVRAVASHRRVKQSSLKYKRTPKKMDTRRPLRTHKWIYWLSRNSVWQVKLPNRKSFTCPTSDEAIRRAALILKAEPKSFKLLAAVPQDHGRDAASAQLRQVFRIVDGSYQRGPPNRFAKWKPADQEYTYKFDLKGAGAKLMNDAGSVLHYMMAKDGPGKTAMEKGFRKVWGKFQKNKQQPNNKAKLDYDGIVEALKILSAKFDKAESQLWSKGPGKGTSHKMGLQMWALKSLGMLEKSTAKGSLPFGQTRRRFRIRPFSKAIDEKLQKTRTYGEALLKTRSSKLMAVRDWTKVTTTLKKASKGVPGFSSGDKYFFRWSTRQWLDRLIQKKGTRKGLHFPAKTKVKALTHAFPDQAKNLTKLCPGSNVDGGLCKTTISDLKKTLNYYAPIQHLTLDLCLKLTAAIRQTLHEVLSIAKKKGPITRQLEKKFIAVLAKVRAANTDRSKCGVFVSPHPAVTVAMARKELLALAGAWRATRS